MIVMTAKDVLRSQVMAQVLEGKLDQASAAGRLGISVRQVKRLKRRMLDEGTEGLLSRKRGKPSNRRTPADVLEKAMALIGAHYADFGPTLACEKLEEVHEIKLSVETVRQAMLRAGLWKTRRGAGARTHAMRERRARRGELIQIDGSPHDWFEGRAPRCCLLVFIDDATGELMALRFVDAETTLGYMALLEEHVLAHGLPAAIYSDRHSIFQVNRGDYKDVSHAQTQFARALEQLGIEGIQANSPQAKGRVERANQTLQDRLVKEMRLQGICSQEAANAWLPQFIRAFNRRFAVVGGGPAAAPGPPPPPPPPPPPHPARPPHPRPLRRHTCGLAPHPVCPHETAPVGQPELPTGRHALSGAGDGTRFGPARRRCGYRDASRQCDGTALARTRVAPYVQQQTHQATRGRRR